MFLPFLFSLFHNSQKLQMMSIPIDPIPKINEAVNEEDLDQVKKNNARQIIKRNFLILT
jgi:hypothetical protein